MSNEWFENGELPPVGTLCEYRVGNFWKPCEIKGEAFDYGQRLVLVQIGDAAKTIGNTELLRPIKSEREKAIEEMMSKILSPSLELYTDQYEYAAARLYDAGYRKFGD